MSPEQVLLEVCDLVELEIANGAVSLPGQSFFAQELEAIQRSDRRNFLKNYVSESLISLLLGVLDQAKCMALVLGTPGIAISPFLLSRGLLEYSHKIAYIAEPEIEPHQRIRRALELYTADLRELNKMSSLSRSNSDFQHVTSSRGLADCWYRELTGKKLRSLSTKAIMDAVWKEGVEGLEEQESSLNVAYEIGYRVGSVIAHGNTWAVRRFCLETHVKAGCEVLKLHLQQPLLLDMLVLAAEILQSSFAYVVQLASTLPASAMNKMEKKIFGLVTMRRETQPN